MWRVRWLASWKRHLAKPSRMRERHSGRQKESSRPPRALSQLPPAAMLLPWRKRWVTQSRQPQLCDCNWRTRDTAGPSTPGGTPRVADLKTRSRRPPARRGSRSSDKTAGSFATYPALLKVIPADPAVEIDRKRFRSVRPSYVARQLKALRTRRQRFSPEQFIEVLFKAYEWARKAEPGATRRLDGRGPVVELVALLDLLTLFPETRKDYGRPEFARDLYLLDRSRVLETNSGQRLELSASTGTKGPTSKLLQVVGEDGIPKVYYGISFTGHRR